MYYLAPGSIQGPQYNFQQFLQAHYKASHYFPPHIAGGRRKTVPSLITPTEQQHRQDFNYVLPDL